jgi:two-component system NtrC family sensor kinase/two-component system sensor histidine kinase AtoS
VFLQNSQANTLTLLFETLRWDGEDYEVNFRERSYLIKSVHHNEKYLLSATDITDQKRKENLATMGQMAAHLSHEIRNPVGAIALLASTLLKRVIPENKPIVTEIQKSLYRIERIIKATLMFSKGIRVYKTLLQWRDIEIELLGAIEYYSYSKEIVFKFPRHDFELDGDFDLLVMMFSNFIFNAIDAIELDENESGNVVLNHEKVENIHRFDIVDSGVGIVDKKGLFEAFKSTKERGNGLGLVLSREIARGHGGDIVFDDTDGKKKFSIILS